MRAFLSPQVLAVANSSGRTAIRAAVRHDIFLIGFSREFERRRRGGVRPHLIALNKLQCVFAVIWPLVRWFGFKMLSSRDTAAETSRELLGAQKAKNAAHQSWRDPYLSYESCANSERQRQHRYDTLRPCCKASTAT